MAIGRDASTFGTSGLQVRQAIRTRTQNDDCDREARKTLLKGKVSIDSDEHVELFRSQRKQFSVLDGRSPHLARRLDLVADDFAREAPINALIDEYLHEAAVT
ncbi:MAG: hypothetical protein H0U97_06800, partial [Gammaproteobacteria bacterium]|nr:hypothetical protein [Gammaproteobacteria bacterium]